MTRHELSNLLDRLKTARVCVVGDLCLDMYLYADMTRSQISRETPHHPLPIVREEIAPGGGGNVMNNVSSLGAQLFPVSVIGRDWRGYLLREYFQEHGLPTDYLVESGDFITPAYVKPMRMGISDVIYEDPRLDFENRAPLSEDDERKLIGILRAVCAQSDVVAVCDQMAYGIITRRVREVLCEIAQSRIVIVDSRSNLRDYLGMGLWLKPNETEAAAALNRTVDRKEDFIRTCQRIGSELSLKNKAPVVLTLGDRGALWCSEGEVQLMPTVKAQPPIDIVGCGDTFLSALSTALALGVDGTTAIALGNLASAVTVKKIGMTGTAAPDEIMAKLEEMTQ